MWNLDKDCTLKISQNGHRDHFFDTCTLRCLLLPPLLYSCFLLYHARYLIIVIGLRWFREGESLERYSSENSVVRGDVLK